MSRVVVPAVAFGALVAAAASPPARNLYEWMALAPVVVAGQVLVDDGRYVEVLVQAVGRGQVAVGQRLLVDPRRANADRSEASRPLELERGADYLLLLRPQRARRGQTIYELARGVEGARPLPPEGAEVWVEAARQLAEVQDRNDEEATWAAFEQMLASDNPILLDTVLELFAKFRRAEPRLLPRLRKLFAHPRPDLRRRALLVAGDAIRGRPEEALPDPEPLLGDIAGRARGDDRSDVRAAAVEALADFPGTRAEALLRQIAREDPEQEVRYRAERALYERAARGRGRS